MKKILLVLFTLFALSCSSSGDSNPNLPDPVVGKWMIYKAEYEQTTYDYEINGQCSAESLDLIQDGQFKFVTETHFNNEDCTAFLATTEWEWRKEEGIYNIYMMGQTVPERTAEFLSDNEMKVTEPGVITVKKYYRRAL